MKRVRWGVIGAGGIALRRTIPEGIVPARNAELAVVYDVDWAACAAVARRFGVASAAGAEELLAADIDAVYIATPVYVHSEQVRQAVAAGKHVLCEKPLGMSVEEAGSMAAEAERAGLRLGVAFMMRFQAQHVAALELIRHGRLGRPVFGRAQLSCWYPPLEGAWRQDPSLGGGGSLIDMGGHTIDLLEMFFGPVRSVSCYVRSSVQNYVPEDSAVAMLSFAGGALGVVDAFFCIPDEASDNVLELYGSRGSILARGTIGQGSLGRMVARLQPEGAGYDAAQARAGAGESEIAPEAVNTYRAEIEEFSQAVLDGRPPAIPAEAGVHSQKVLAACYESALTGRAVDVL